MKRITFIFLILASMYNLQAQDVFDTARNGSVADIQKIYEKNPESINEINSSGYDPLTLACYNGNVAVVKFLVSKVKNVNGASTYGTPLMAAVYKRDLPIVNLLIDHKADVNHADKNGVTALHYATMFNDTKISVKLISAGADYNKKDTNGRTAHDYAKSYKNETILNLIQKQKL